MPEPAACALDKATPPEKELVDALEAWRPYVEKAKGGVLFIDEAYTLVGRGEKDFGIEAIEEIMRVMNEGDPVCIFAGYKGEMSEFIEANPGLYRRITRKFNFNDYKAAILNTLATFLLGFYCSLATNEYSEISPVYTPHFEVLVEPFRETTLTVYDKFCF